MAQGTALKISIVCATYRGAHRLANLIGSMTPESTQGCDLTVIDDGSPEIDRHSSEIVTSTAPLISRFIGAPRNGWIAAINYAVPQTVGDVVLLLDDDTRLPPTLIETLRGLMSGLDNVGVLSWRSYGDKPGQSKTARPGFLQPATELAAYCMAIPRSIWDKMGGLDPRYHVYCSDSDLALRASLAGHPCYRVWWPLVPHEEHKCAEEATEIDWRSVAARDAAAFREKWGKSGGEMEREALWGLANV